jgi:hypothetical protein
MIAERRCCCCGQDFRPRPQNPSQTYCSRPSCQRERKRAWQRRKRAEDPDYRANERSAQRRWSEAHPGYWQQWREAHSEYVQRNRATQRERNARRRAGEERDAVALATDASWIAKGDAWTGETSLPSGTYRLKRWQDTEDCKRGRVETRNLFVISALGPI